MPTSTMGWLLCLKKSLSRVSKTRCTRSKCSMSQSGWLTQVAVPLRQRFLWTSFKTSPKSATKLSSKKDSRQLLDLPVSSGLVKTVIGAKATGGAIQTSTSGLCTIMTGWLRVVTNLIHSQLHHRTGASTTMRRSSLVRRQAFRALRHGDTVISQSKINLLLPTKTAGSVSCRGQTRPTMATVTSTPSKMVSNAHPTGASAKLLQLTSSRKSTRRRHSFNELSSWEKLFV